MKKATAAMNKAAVKKTNKKAAAMKKAVKMPRPAKKTTDEDGEQVAKATAEKTEKGTSLSHGIMRIRAKEEHEYELLVGCCAVLCGRWRRAVLRRRHRWRRAVLRR